MVERVLDVRRAGVEDLVVAELHLREAGPRRELDGVGGEEARVAPPAIEDEPQPPIFLLHEEDAHHLVMRGGRCILDHASCLKGGQKAGPLSFARECPVGVGPPDGARCEGLQAL